MADMSIRIPSAPTELDLKEWGETRDLVKQELSDHYDELIEPFRAVIRGECGTLISPYQLLFGMASNSWGGMTKDRRMATIAAAFDVHEEREQARAG